MFTTMKRVTFVFLSIIISIVQVKAQEKGLKEQMLNHITEEACKCIDSISAYNKEKSKVTKEIHECINKEVITYQVTRQMMDIDTSLLEDKKNEKKRSKKDKKNVEILVNTDENSKEYKADYYEIERYLMENCESLKMIIKADDKQTENSLTKDDIALEFYNKGVDEVKAGNLENAIVSFKTSIKYDSKNAFAWDNIGVCYRKLEKYDEALDAYQHSLELDSNGLTPLMNIAVVYNYKKEFENAINAYKKLDRVSPGDPEVNYGIGLIYAMDLKDYEQGLNYLCKAYNQYIKDNSPYRTDAEKAINLVYEKMKKSHKEKRFYEIMKQNGINVEK
jgi:tetratricopeptide (TPR) repeat protein